jgi:hypothetical protein
MMTLALSNCDHPMVALAIQFLGSKTARQDFRRSIALHPQQDPNQADPPNRGKWRTCVL